MAVFVRTHAHIHTGMLTYTHTLAYMRTYIHDTYIRACVRKYVLFSFPFTNLTTRLVDIA